MCCFGCSSLSSALSACPGPAAKKCAILIKVHLTIGLLTHSLLDLFIKYQAFKQLLLHIHISLPELPGSQGTWEYVSTGLKRAKKGCKKGAWHLDRRFPIQNALETFPHLLGHLWYLHNFKGKFRNLV
jgi:hypothetical protein